MLTYIILKNNIKVFDSYKVFKRKEIKKYIQVFKYYDSDNIVLKNRSTFSIICEWKTHTLLYHLNLYKEHTKDVDINYPEQKKYLLLYYIIGTLTYIF